MPLSYVPVGLVGTLKSRTVSYFVYSKVETCTLIQVEVDKGVEDHY